ncbi:cell wall assembly regulator SMI1 [Streptomyces cinereoruber]|nr:cell wall assembly regulator SMI1 [Streptomyces cinereoruber]NIH63451.1 cell wall assembly regulator SMI1 [Streptomyces cinereoruber]
MNERGPVEVAFGRVEAWLAKHAPVSYRTLKAPAEADPL